MFLYNNVARINSRYFYSKRLSTTCYRYLKILLLIVYIENWQLTQHSPVNDEINDHLQALALFEIGEYIRLVAAHFLVSDSITSREAPT